MGIFDQFKKKKEEQNINVSNSGRKTTKKMPGEKLYIGMPFKEIVNLLGKPSGINPGTEMIEGPGSVVASARTVSQLARTKYCMWKCPEGIYLLVIENDKLARIHSRPE